MTGNLWLVKLGGLILHPMAPNKTFFFYLTLQAGCVGEIRSNGIGIRSIDAQTTDPYDQDNRIMVNVILKYLPIALFLSNNHPEMYCTIT